MPGFDGTGPAGAGKMTGWGRGPCGGDRNMETAGTYGRGLGLRRGMGMRCDPGFGRGMSMGRGFGRGFGPGDGSGFRAWAAQGPETDGESLKEALVGWKSVLKARLEAIDKRLETL